MYLKDLIESYRKKLNDNSNDYSCILFALQIPSICSRIEFPKTDENKGGLKEGKFYGSKGRVWDGNMYKAWLKSIVIVLLISIVALWELRSFVKSYMI